MGNLRKNTQKGPSPASSRKVTDSVTTPEKNSVEQIRHILFPNIPVHGIVDFHATKLIFSLIALALQHLNIYRTVWWLGRPWVKYTIDIDSIDFYLVSYILLMLIISPIYDAYQILYWRANTPLRNLNCILAIKSRKTQQSIWQFFSPGTPRSKTTSQVNKTPRYSPFMPARYAMILHPSSNPTATFYTLRMPPKQHLTILKHSCARCSPAITENAAQMIRDEAEIFYADFSARLFDTIVGAVVSTFYCTILPCLFVPKGLNLDLVWCLSHALFSMLTFLLLHWQYLLPPAYLDLLHRCALHLGGWQELSPSAHSGYLNWPAWSLLQIYPKNVHVKHVRGLFQSLGVSNSAEPGNPSHSRIFFWFSSPTKVMNSLCYAAVVVSLALVCVLELTFEWNKLIGLSAVSPFILLNLYRLLRNRTIIAWIWDDDNPIYEPAPTPPQTANLANSVKT
ncbi:hypothetical protein Aperf_G00000115251 [Anoplocephala perfoliata]